MAQLRSDGPYIWATWLSGLLVGDRSCEWASWFRAHHEGRSWHKVPSDFSQAAWLSAHADAVRFHRERWIKLGYHVTQEDQNQFVLSGRRATLAGKPDLIATRGPEGVIVDVKTGKPSPAHMAQVMIYMYAVPRGIQRYQGVEFSGQIAYPEYGDEIPAGAVDREFLDRLIELLSRLASTRPALRVPSPRECRFCDISRVDCPDRIEHLAQPTGYSEDF